MRTPVETVLLFGLVFVTGNLAFAPNLCDAQEKKNAASEQFIGTWKLISANYGGEEQILEDVTLKHFTPTSFVWTSFDPKTKLVSRTAGGIYTLNGDQIVETPQYGLGEDFEIVRDKPQTFSFKIEGDRWHHSGTLSNGLKIDEVWERCKK